MRKVRLFVADVDASHVEHVARSLQGSPEIELVDHAADGLDAFRKIVTLHPDALLTDIPLPGIDGIMLLKDLRDAGRTPISIVCTSLYSDACITRACRYGARYFMYKPLDYRRLPGVVLDCARERAPAGKTKPIAGDTGIGQFNEVRAQLVSLGIPAKLSGSLYLIESLLCLLNDEGLLRNLSKGLYAEVAKRTNVPVSSVERAIRNAIAVASVREPLRAVFPERPTNRVFLQFLLARIRKQTVASAGSPKDYLC